MWVLALILVPFIAALVCLITRGSGMAERSVNAAVRHREAQDAYIRDVAGHTTPSQQIAMHGPCSMQASSRSRSTTR